MMKITATAAVLAGADPKKLEASPVFLLSTRGVPFVEYVATNKPVSVSIQESHLRVRFGRGEFVAALAVAGNYEGERWATMTLKGALIPRAPGDDRPESAKTWLTRDEISALVAEHARRSAIAARKRQIRHEIARLHKRTRSPGFSSRMALARARREKESRKSYFERLLKTLAEHVGETFAQRAKRASECMKREWPIHKAWLDHTRRKARRKKQQATAKK